MPSSSFAHAIGVMGMMAGFFLIVSFLTGVEQASLRSQAEPLLADIANYVASYVVDMVLVPNSTQPTTLIKQIEIPRDVGGQGYTVQLELDSDTWKVTARLDTMHSTYAEVALPWKASGNIHVVAADVDMGTWSKRSFLYSGTPNPIVWSERTGSSCEVGLGSLSQLAAISIWADSASQTFMHIRVTDQHTEHGELNSIHVRDDLRNEDLCDCLQLDAGRMAFTSRDRREIRGCM